MITPHNLNLPIKVMRQQQMNTLMKHATNTARTTEIVAKYLMAHYDIVHLRIDMIYKAS